MTASNGNDKKMQVRIDILFVLILVLLFATVSCARLGWRHRSTTRVWPRCSRPGRRPPTARVSRSCILRRSSLRARASNSSCGKAFSRSSGWSISESSSPKRWRRRTRSGSSTATSSPPISWWDRMAVSRSSTSGWRKGSGGPGSPETTTRQ